MINGVLCVGNNEKIRYVCAELKAKIDCVDICPSIDKGLATQKERRYSVVLIDIASFKDESEIYANYFKSINYVSYIAIVSFEHTSISELELYSSGYDDFYSNMTIIDLISIKILKVVDRFKNRFFQIDMKDKDLVLDTFKKSIIYFGEEHKLNEIEYVILCHLLTNKDRIINRNELCYLIKLYCNSKEIVSLDKYAIRVIHKLRDKLPNLFIDSIRGIGYEIRK